MTPNTTVTLYATPFDISNKYVIKADSQGEALAIVSNYPSKVYTDCYWQRDNEYVFRANGNINEVEQYNYCVFLNNGRYNFAFITEFTYVNDAMTLCHLIIDPWLNYAGQYTFHDSPMIRCHPYNDTGSGAFYTVEPFEMHAPPKVKHVTGGDPSQNELQMYIVTSIKAASLPIDTAVTDYWNGMLQLAQQSGVGTLIAWSQRIQAHYTNAGNVIQPNTSIADLTTGAQIIASFIQNGLADSIIGAYYVPTSLNVGASFTLDADNINSVFFDFQVDTSIQTTAHKWRKMLLSPQFRRLILNAAGNTREIPFEYLAPMTTTEDPITIRTLVNPSMNGNFTMKVRGISDIMDNYLCQSPTWDRVPVIGYGVDNTVFKQAMLNTVTNIGSTAFDVAGILTDKVGILKRGLIGTAAEVAESAFNTVAGEYQNNINTQRQIMNGGITIGGASGSMVVYNQTAPLFMADLYSPSETDCVRLSEMFGTYGYMQDGQVIPITPGRLPYWTYYQTQDASIAGNRVPQKYLNQIIARFNAGIFIFNDTAGYKDFSKAGDNHY